MPSTACRISTSRSPAAPARSWRNWSRADRVGRRGAAARSGADFASLTEAGDALEAAVSGYFEGKPRPLSDPETTKLREQLTHHIANARQLAEPLCAARAVGAVSARARWNRIYQRIASAGGSGLVINGTQVIARRSLGRTEKPVVDAVRGETGSAAAVAQREREFAAVLAAHSAELRRPRPGAPGLAMIREDIALATHLRLEVASLWTPPSAGVSNALIEEMPH